MARLFKSGSLVRSVNNENHHYKVVTVHRDGLLKVQALDDHSGRPTGGSFDHQPPELFFAISRAPSARRA